jgi:predicted ABC-type sugar transport system permease subunit
MGFMLALRCGAVDLSVWASAGLGGVVSAVLLGKGQPPAVAIAAGISAGAVCGLINGVLVAGLRLPCPIISGLMAFGLIRWLGTRFPSGEIVLGDGALDGLLGGFQSVADWLGLPEVTLQAAAAIAVFVIYSVTMLVILNGEVVERHSERKFSERWRLLAALTASGALSAAGGVAWLVEHKMTPVPGRPVDDLVIPAAALLAGGLYLAGAGRTLLAGVLLPGALAVATGWRQEVLNLRSDFLVGYPLQLVCLMAMVAIARYAMSCAAIVGRRHGAALALAWGSSVGIAVFAASVWAETPEARDIMHAAGGAMWLAGAAGAIALKLASPCRTAE